MQDYTPIPDSVRKAGPSAVLRFIHDASPVGVFLRNPGVKSIIAEDIMLDRAQAIIDTPSFLEGEDNLVREWLSARGAFGKELDEIAREALSAFAPFDNEVSGRRLLLRLAAYRRLDMVFSGRQIFAPCPEMGGEPYSAVVLPDHPDAMPVGTVSSVTFEIDPRQNQAVRAFIIYPARAEIVEAAIEPLHRAESGPEGWRNVFETRATLAAAAQWERKYPHPALLRGVILDTESPPAGVELRSQVNEMVAQAGNTGSIKVLHWLGMSPFILTAFKPYLAANGAAVSEIAQDPDISLKFVATCPALMALADQLSAGEAET